jgi:acetoin utilization deacetylase AcuC-like enzyme
MSTGGTGFFFDERCFWHSGGNYAFTMHVGGPGGGLVQPSQNGLPENPETKRRLKNLVEVTGLIQELHPSSAPAATREELLRVHPAAFLDRFKELSEAEGGELGLRTPFAKGGYDLAALSAGLSRGALFSVLEGRHRNAYALSRPPGHHCLPDWPNGFCLLANIAVAIEAARAAGLCKRVAVVDWDVHHGNGTEAIFYDRDDVLTISVHQEHNYPLDTGDAADRGTGPGEGFNMNIPLPAGAGHATYLEAMDRLILPALSRFKPDAIVVACGFDAAAVDPLGRMLCTAETFREMTARVMAAADELCDGRLVLVHEGGYSEAYVPFCGHAVLAELSGSAIEAPDPLAHMFAARQPKPAMEKVFSTIIDELETLFLQPG